MGHLRFLDSLLSFFACIVTVNHLRSLRSFPMSCEYGSWKGQPPCQFSKNCATFPGGTLAAEQNIQYDNCVICDPWSLDAVIPDFLSGPLRRRLQTSTRC